MLHSSSSSSSSSSSAAAAASLGKARRVQWIHIKYENINYIKVSILDIQLAAAFKLFESYTKTPGSRSNLWSFFGRPVHEQVKFANKVLLLLMKAIKLKQSIQAFRWSGPFLHSRQSFTDMSKSTSSLPAAAFFFASAAPCFHSPGYLGELSWSFWARWMFETREFQGGWHDHRFWMWWWWPSGKLTYPFKIKIKVVGLNLNMIVLFTMAIFRGYVSFLNENEQKIGCNDRWWWWDSQWWVLSLRKVLNFGRWHLAKKRQILEVAHWCRWFLTGA